MMKIYEMTAPDDNRQGSQAPVSAGSKSSLPQSLLVRALASASMLALMACSNGEAGLSRVLPSQMTQNQAASYQEAPQTAQAQSGGLKAIADDLAAKGEHDAAIPLYRHLGAATGDPAVLASLATSLTAMGSHQEALGIYDMLSTRGQMTPDAWYGYGKVHLAMGHFDTALSAFDAAAQQAPADSRIKSARGIALAALGREDEAFAAFRDTVDPTGLSNLALLFAMTDKADAAITILEPLARAGAAGPRTRQNLALAYLLAGRDSDATKMARLDLDPGSVNETFTFYRSLKSLSPSRRMQALVTGTVDPAWTRDEAANLALADIPATREAAKRLTAKPLLVKAQTEPSLVAEIVKPVPVPEKPAPTKDVANYELTEIPPLVEPEGWALQIGAYRTVGAMMRGWSVLFRANSDLLADIPPRRSEVDFGDQPGKPRGFYYRLNAGPLKSLAEARTLCRELKARGTACWIRPPEKTEGTLPDTPKTPQTNGQLTASLS